MPKQFTRTVLFERYSNSNTGVDGAMIGVVVSHDSSFLIIHTKHFLSMHLLEQQRSKQLSSKINAHVPYVPMPMKKILDIAIITPT